MRLGVLDVGSNTVHLLVVDAHPGARPWPATSHKVALQLASHLTDEGLISDSGARQLSSFVSRATEVAEDHGCQDLFAFATSAIREAPNAEQVLGQVEKSSGVQLRVLSGGDEARLTFLAVRRWFGWSAGRVLALDIGGGSLEIAVGIDEDPDLALSLPLGAGRLTRMHLPQDPPTPKQVKALRKVVRAEIATAGRDLAKAGEADLVVGSSKTLRSLARICGAAPSTDGPYTPRSLKLADLSTWVPKIATLDSAQCAQLPGVSDYRARQLLAGALVAEAAMELTGTQEMKICPWALREGIILRLMDQLVRDPNGHADGRVLGHAQGAQLLNIAGLAQMPTSAAPALGALSPGFGAEVNRGRPAP